MASNHLDAFMPPMKVPPCVARTLLFRGRKGLCVSFTELVKCRKPKGELCTLPLRSKIDFTEKGMFEE